MPIQTILIHEGCVYGKQFAVKIRTDRRDMSNGKFFYLFFSVQGRSRAADLCFMRTIKKSIFEVCTWLYLRSEREGTLH